MSIEAMKESLKALEAMKSDRCAEEKIHINSAIAFLRQSIEQAEKQKPVGYFYLRKNVFFHVREPQKADPELFPLYTAPPRKPWVGLTDDERSRYKGYTAETFVDGVIWAEAKLKEKNG